MLEDRSLLSGLSLRLEVSGGSSVQVDDQGPNDADTNVGTVQFNGSIDIFSLQVTTGVGLNNQLVLSNVSLSSGGAGTLTILLTNTDYSGMGTIDVESSVGGVQESGGVASFQSFLDSSNSQFATAGATVTTGGLQGPFATSPFANDLNSQSTQNGSYSITQRAEISMQAGQIMSLNGSTIVSAPAGLGDYVWHDINGNGVQDSGEPAVDGVTATLTGGGADSVIGTGGDDTTAIVTTGDNPHVVGTQAGYYEFLDLNPGEEYKVTFSNLPAGFEFTDHNAGGDDTVDSDADPSNGMTQIVTLAEGEFNPTLDAGILQKAGLGDYVWEDLNGNGIQDNGEPGVDGVKVTLTGGGPDGVIGTGGDDTMVMVFTGDNPNIAGTQMGYYEFLDLNPGEQYKVTFSDLPAGFDFTDHNAGGDDTVDSDADPSNGMTQIVTLSSGEFNPTLDAGILEPAGLGDYVWEDLNGNGVQDVGEPGVDGVKVTLTGGGPDGVIGTGGDDTMVMVLTGDNPHIAGTQMGYYEFTGLNPGEQYKVTFSDLPSGYDFTGHNVGGDDTVDSDADPSNGMTQIVTLSSGEFNPTLDAGILAPAGLGDYVWIDQDNDGVQDAGEPGVNGVTVTLTGGGPDGVIGSGGDDTTAVTTTADNPHIAGTQDGYYEFTGLNPGEEYKVTFSNTPAGFEYTLQGINDGGANPDERDSDADPSNGMTHIVILASNEFDPTIDAGLIETEASLGDYVWHDLDGDGVQDAGEPGVDNVTVTLTGGGADGVIGTGGDDTTVSVTTGDDPNTAGTQMGYYEFLGLIPGVEYKVTFSDLPAGFEFTAHNAGSDDAVDSDADPSNGMTQIVTLAGGEHNPTLDAGIVTPGIDIEKATNGEDADDPDGADVPEIIPGATVTWTYEVTNTGSKPFPKASVVVVDDNGTPSDNSDDFNPAPVESGGYNVGDTNQNDVLDPGETWQYSATAAAEDLSGGSTSTETFILTGNSGLDGSNGNVRTYTAGGISLKANAWSRDSGGAWETAFLGAFGSGLGVTDNSEGNGGNGTHRVDNIGRDNYVLFRFDQDVIVDRAFLDSVVGDSDLSVWVGTIANAYTSSITLSDAVLSGMDLNEVNNTGSSSSRWANFNGGEVVGNVLVLAASTADTTPEDCFKIKKVVVSTPGGPGVYGNKGKVTANGVMDMDPSHYTNPEEDPGLDIEKHTNGQDADSPNGSDVPEIAPGDAVTWTYYVENTGNVPFNKADVVVTDDNGTTSTADDFTASPVLSGGFVVGDADTDNVLDPGETWTYTASGVAQDLGGGSGDTVIFNLTGNSGTDGTNGNVRSYSAGDVSLKANAWSRDSGGAWETAFLGAFGSGLGVTDNSEGNGGNGLHRIDNVGRHNYILFRFDQDVVVNKAFLDSVVNDSDLEIWVGSVVDAYNMNLTLSDAFLAGMDLNEVNNTSSSSYRWADVNNGEVVGNVLVVAASTADSTPEDRFKLRKLKVASVEGEGVYGNKGTVNVGNVSAMDPSHYKNPEGGGGDDTKFFVVDDSALKTFEYAADGTAGDNYGIAPNLPFGVTADVTGEHVWVVDYYGKVYHYDNDGGLTASWHSNRSKLHGIATDGEDIWTVKDVGSNPGKVYFYNDGATATTNRYPNGYFRLHSYNTNPRGITTDGTHIWVVNEGNQSGGVGDKVYKYTVGGQYVGRWQLDSDNRRPTGITINPGGGDKIWIVDSSSKSVFEYSGATTKHSGGLNATDEFDLAAGNHCPQGIADPPPATGSSVQVATPALPVVADVFEPVADVIAQPISDLGMDLFDDVAEMDRHFAVEAPTAVVTLDADETTDATGTEATEVLFSDAPESEVTDLVFRELEDELLTGF